jgi:hypothetical protein
VDQHLLASRKGPHDRYPLDYLAMFGKSDCDRCFILCQRNWSKDGKSKRENHATFGWQPQWAEPAQPHFYTHEATSLLMPWP